MANPFDVGADRVTKRFTSDVNIFCKHSASAGKPTWRRFVFEFASEIKRSLVDVDKSYSGEASIIRMTSAGKRKSVLKESIPDAMRGSDGIPGVGMDFSDEQRKKNPPSDCPGRDARLGRGLWCWHGPLRTSGGKSALHESVPAAMRGSGEVSGAGIDGPDGRRKSFLPWIAPDAMRGLGGVSGAGMNLSGVRRKNCPT